MKELFLFVSLAFLGGFCREITPEFKEKIQEAFCEAQCLDKDITSPKCEKSKCDCASTTSNVSSRKSGGDDIKWEADEDLMARPELLCKDERILTFKWERSRPLIYILEYRTEESQWHYADMTSCSMLTIRRLTPDTNYQIRLWGVSPNGDIFSPANSSWIKTSSKGYTPLPVVKLDLVKLQLAEENFNALLEWKPAADRTCFYDIIRLDMSNFNDFKPYEIRKTNDLFRINMAHIQFESTYSIGISSRNIDLDRESMKIWYNFTAPTCLETYHNLIHCVPPPPEDLLVVDDLNEPLNITHPTYNIALSWSKPNFTPDYYLVSLYYPFTENATEIVQNVTGKATSALFQSVPITIDYEVVVKAGSIAGESKPSYLYNKLNATNLYRRLNATIVVSSPLRSNSAYYPIIFGSLGGLLGLVLIAAIVLHRRSKFKKAKRQSEAMTSKYYDDSFKQKFPDSMTDSSAEYYIPEIANDEWYLNSEQVVMDELLGEGAFGVVHKGCLKRSDGNVIKVAIKMLKGNPTMEEIRQFEHEIEIMKCVGSNPHIVSLVGCCAKLGYQAPFLVVEYCAKGDLQSYLRAAWEQISGQSLEMRYINTPSPPNDFKTENHFSNKIYELFDDTLLEPRDLLSFARQIALGMEYLANLRVVHRDLAARNVLMCSDRTVKVADFGLSRDVYQDNIYMKTGAGKLPVKWMALESLSHQQYTTQSDVWSFGIVLWEIVTLGGNPYTTIETRNLMSFLKSGYRMECPTNCSEELYDIMKLCWNEVPKERPTFSELWKMLEKLLENENRYISLDVRF